MADAPISDGPIGDSGAIALFIDHLAAARGAARNTIIAYRRDLEQASDAVGGGLAMADAAALARLARSWAPLARSSAARKASAVRQFLAFLMAEGLRADDPGRDLASPRGVRPLPKTLATGDVERLFAALAEQAAARPDDPATLRLAALVELLYGSGLRASELVALPRRSVAGIAHGALVITGKGGKDRLVPISRAAAAAVAAWAVHVPADARYLFPAGANRRQGPDHLSRLRLWQLVKGLAVAAGLPPQRLSPHVLRHAFATHLLEGGADLRVVQTLLGHEHVVTTQIYTHVAAAALVELVNRRHPLARQGRIMGAPDSTGGGSAAAPLGELS